MPGQTEYIRLGVDPRPGVQGSAELVTALAGVGRGAGVAELAMLGVTGAVAIFAGMVTSKALKAAIDWESALTGVAKTTDLTALGLAAMGRDLQELSKTIPVTANELAKIAETAGQLGIAEENIVSFTRVMADLGVATNLTSDEAATALARFANVMQTPQDEFDRLGSTIVGLGNNFATTEREIVEFAQRMSGAGKIVGLTEAQVLGISAALSSVGVEAEAGGTAVQTVLLQMNAAVFSGGQALEDFAAAAGMSAEQFREAWRSDAGTAFQAFIEGLGRQGDAANATLEKLGLANVRITRSFLSLANAGGLLGRSLDQATTDFEENVALSEEAERRYVTLASQLLILKNQFIDIAVAIGDNMAPAVEGGVSGLSGFLDVMGRVNQQTNEFQMLLYKVLSPLELIKNVLAVTKPPVEWLVDLFDVSTQLEQDFFRKFVNPQLPDVGRGDAGAMAPDLPSDRLAALDEERAATQAWLDGIREATAATAAMDAERRKAEDEAQKELEDRIQLLAEANELGLLGAEGIAEAARLYEAARFELDNMNPSLERQVELWKRLETLAAAYMRTLNTAPRNLPGLDADWQELLQTRDITGTGGGAFFEQIEGSRSGFVTLSADSQKYAEDQKKRWEDNAKDAARAAEQTRDAWVTALNGVGAAVGGIGQDFAALAGALMAGGPAGALGAVIAGAGIAAGRVGGREGWDVEQERLAQAANEAAEALAAMTRAIEDDARVRNLVIQGLNEEADALRLQITQQQELAELSKQFQDAFGFTIEETLAGLDPADQLGPENTTAWADALRAYIDLQALHNSEMKALYAEQQELEAQRIAQQQQDREQFGFGLAGREAALDDDGRAALQADLAARADAEMFRAQALLDATTITQGQFDRLVAVLEGEMAEALAAYDQALLDSAAAAREAAAAEQFRQMQDLRSLDLQIFRMEGREQEALDLQQLVELDNALHEMRSQEYLDKLNQLHLLQDQALAAQMAAQSQQAATFAVQETTRELNRMTSALNAPQGFNLAGIRSGVLGGSASVSVGDFNITIVQQPGQSAEDLANAVARAVNRSLAGGGPNLLVPRF